jgi:YNFM family putative membrane transporter
VTAPAGSTPARPPADLDSRLQRGGDDVAVVGFLVGAFAMFASMYSTQAILPELSRDFGVSPSRAGLSVSALVLALAACAWVWGPLSDRIGRPAAMRLASSLLVLPSLLVAVAPTFEVLVAARALQGATMPGLLVVGAPYVIETLVPRYGARAMGWYVGTLVLGGLVGRVGVALVAGAIGWRAALAILTALPLAAVVAMRGLPEGAAPSRSSGPVRAVISLQLVAVTLAGCALFFVYVGTFTYVPYRLEAPPFDLSVSRSGLVFLILCTGFLGPLFGRIAEHVGWRRLAAAAVCASAIGLAVTTASSLPLVIAGLALVAGGMFAGYTAAQLGVGDVARTDRGAASAFYFSVYYAMGALGGYVPGLAWERWAWSGVVVCALGALGVAAAALVALRRLRDSPVDAAAGAPYAPGA